MANMMRKNIGNEHVCMYGEKCCAPFSIHGKSSTKWKTKQRQISRRRENAQWRKNEY